MSKPKFGCTVAAGRALIQRHRSAEASKAASKLGAVKDAIGSVHALAFCFGSHRRLISLLRLRNPQELQRQLCRLEMFWLGEKLKEAADDKARKLLFELLQRAQTSGLSDYQIKGIWTGAVFRARTGDDAQRLASMYDGCRFVLQAYAAQAAQALSAYYAYAAADESDRSGS